MAVEFKFGFVEEIQDTEIQDTRYRNGSFRKVFCISCIFVSCNLYLTEKLQFEDLPSVLRAYQKPLSDERGFHDE